MALRFLVAKSEAPPVQTVAVESTVEPAIHVELQVTPAIEPVVQEYLQLYAALAAINGKSIVKRLETLRKELVTYANAHVADEHPAVFTCAAGTLEFSERGRETVVTKPVELLHDLIEKFDQDVAFSVVSILLTPLRQLLSEWELTQYTKEIPGNRTLRLVQVQPPSEQPPSEP